MRKQCDPTFFTDHRNILWLRVISWILRDSLWIKRDLIWLNVMHQIMLIPTWITSSSLSYFNSLYYACDLQCIHLWFIQIVLWITSDSPVNIMKLRGITRWITRYSQCILYESQVNTLWITGIIKWVGITQRAQRDSGWNHHDLMYDIKSYRVLFDS